MPLHSDSTLAAIKQAVDIVTLVGDYLQLHRRGRSIKALCPFHDDHNPSLELNSERQSFKCWVCGAGGDIFDFVKAYERVDFPEALRMLAERAGIALEAPSSRPTPEGPSKTELLKAMAWAEETYAKALAQSQEAQAYVAKRGLSPEAVAQFRLGFAPESADWLLAQARRDEISVVVLERAGILIRDADNPQYTRDRFRGRLIFPIHDFAGRAVGFGGRILPSTEQRLAEKGQGVAKYLNSPESFLFQKRQLLYAADLAQKAARQAGWVAVVEGYTDVIAAHQVGLANVVATLGTALGDDHMRSLRRLTDRAVLVYDGDDAGQAAADRALEFFLGHDLDVRVLTLPVNLDPCDFLLKEGADAFRTLVDTAVDPLTFALGRAESRFDFSSEEGARKASDWVLAILARVPARNRVGADIKVNKAIDRLAERLRVPAAVLIRRFKEIARPTRTAVSGVGSVGTPASSADSPPRAVRLSDLDPLDRELIHIVLNDPSLVGEALAAVPAGALREPPLKAILQACYDLHREGEEATFERLALRIDDELRALAAGFLLPLDPQPVAESIRPAAWDMRLKSVLVELTKRSLNEQIRDLERAMAQLNPETQAEEYQALRLEYFRLNQQRATTKKNNTHAS